MLKHYDRLIAAISSPWPESLVLLFVRVVFAGIFWRSGLAKMADGSWFTISDGTWELFRTEYSGVPLPPELAAPLAAGAEHLFPVLLVAGLFTRVSALALLVMTVTIQIFVYPDAWWTEHSLWTALALVLIVRGGGNLAIDKLLTRRREA
ncbi:MAG: DoxX family protein [Novosphingobium sp.]